jgi:hypothetical protein
MKKLLPKIGGFLWESIKATPRPARVLILALTGTLICTVIALAAVVLFVILADMNIVPGEQAAEVFLDEECTIPVPAVHWGDIERGTHQQLDLYVKNTGVEDIDVSIIIPEDVSTVMTYSITPVSIPLAADEVGHFTFSADILPTAPLGAVSWNYQGETP